MECKNYIGAAKILEELCKYEKHENIEYSYRALGHCYYELGSYEKALNWFSKSYELYRSNILLKNDSTYKECYRELVHLYCATLEKEGKMELSNSNILGTGKQS